MATFADFFGRVAAAALVPLLLAGCEDERRAPPPAQPLVQREAAPRPLVPAQPPDAGSAAADAGEPDFRAQRLQALRTHSDVYTAAEIGDMYRARGAARPSRWDRFVSQPHSTATVGSLLALFEKSRDDELRVAALYALGADHTPDVTALFQGLEQRPDFKEGWIVPLVAAREGASDMAWREAHVGKSPAWDAALVGTELSPESAQRIFRERRNAPRVRAHAFSSGPHSPELCAEALASGVQEVELAALDSRCAEVPRAFLERALAGTGDLRREAARRVLDDPEHVRIGPFEISLALRLASDRDDYLRGLALGWWSKVVGPNARDLAPQANGAARSALERALADRQSAAASQSGLVLVAAEMEELDGEFDRAISTYRRVLALPQPPDEAEQRSLHDDQFAANLHLVDLYQAQGRKKDLEQALTSLEKSPGGWTGDTWWHLPLHDGPPALAARLRAELNRPLQLSASVSRDRKKLLVRVMNRGSRSITLDFIDGGPHGSSGPVPRQLFARAGRQSLSCGILSAPYAPGTPTPLPPGKSLEFSLPLGGEKLPPRFELAVSIEVGLPPELRLAPSEEREQLLAISEVK